MSTEQDPISRTPDQGYSIWAENLKAAEVKANYLRVLMEADIKEADRSRDLYKEAHAEFLRLLATPAPLAERNI